MIGRLFLKYKGVILYLFFGGCTTLINVTVYAACTRVLAMETIPANGAAWVLAVSFAYITNKLWVFESRVRDLRGVVRELTAFFLCRIATGLLDMVMMYLSVDVLGFHDLVMKVISNGLVIIFNFLFSKLVIFKKKDGT